MYIIFNNEGDEFLRYFDKKMPEELKENKYIEINEKNIPTKEGFVTRAKLLDGEVEWVFDAIEKPIDTREEINGLKEENKLLQLAIMEIALANEEKTEEAELAIAELTNLIGEVL